MNHPLTSRADLLRALAYDDPALSTATAALLGYESDDTPVVLPDVPSFPAQHQETNGSVETTTYQPAPVPFWRVEEFTAVAPVELPPPPPTLTVADLKWCKRPTTIPGFTPLATKREVLTALRKIGATRRMTNDVDVEAVVERVSQGHFLQQIPHRSRRSWGSAITIVEDRARRLVPYWLDQEYVIDALKNLYPPNGITVTRIGDGDDQPVIRWPEEQCGQAVSPVPGTIVLVLGDLGCLAHQAEYLCSFWVRWGLQLRAQGNPPVALVPAQTTDIPPDLARTWTIVRWGATSPVSTGSPVQAKTNAVRQLLTLLSPAVRVEPGLLRAVRGVFPEGRNDPGLEARVWQDAAMASQHSVAASWDPEQRKTYKERFAEQPESVRQVVPDVIRPWRATLHHAVWFEEIVELDGQSQRGGIEPTDLEDAVTFFSVFAETVSQAPQVAVDTKAWISRVTERYDTVAGSDPRVTQALHRFYEVIRPRSAEVQVPGWYDPGILPPPPGQPVRQVALWQMSDQLLVRTIKVSSRADPDSGVRGSPLGIVHTANGRVTMAVGEPGVEKKRELDLNPWARGSTVMPQDAAFLINTDRDRLRFGRVTLPQWASEIGRDAYGLWAEFAVDKVRQRMRWIPPGRFWMGSPEDEEGRDRNEGPRHEVQLTHGFWLFDAPCTQALWQAVMGQNPSYFKGEAGKERPVEQVSWEDCQEFIATLNARLPGVTLALPTEAEWEYACRAGTDTPRYEDYLDAIAWYRENSNHQTHEVKLKRPNAWGLYDMLGNVDEWCHDGLRDYTAEVVVDPLGPTEAGAGRAVRGGYWLWVAQDVRAADRLEYSPGFRDETRGFRCASSSQAG